MHESGSGVVDPRPRHPWRDERAALTDLGGDWREIDQALMWVPYPKQFPPDSPTINSIGGRLDFAFVPPDQHTGLRALLRHYYTP